MLSGYKTYIAVIFGIIAAALYGMGYIDNSMFITILTVLGFGTAAGLRTAIKNK